MQNHSDENVYVVIMDVTDMDTGKSVEPNMEDEAKYAEDLQRFMDLVGEAAQAGDVDEDPGRPNVYIARNERVGLEIRFTVYHGAK